MVDAANRHHVGRLNEFQPLEVRLGIDRRQREDPRHRTPACVGWKCQSADVIAEHILQRERRRRKHRDYEGLTIQFGHSLHIGNEHPIAGIEPVGAGARTYAELCP